MADLNCIVGMLLTFAIIKFASHVLIANESSHAQADESSQATEEEEHNQDDDTIFRHYQLQEQERHRQRHYRNTTSSVQEPPSDQLGWSIFSLVIVPYIGVAALIFSELSIKSRIQGRVLTTV